MTAVRRMAAVATALVAVSGLTLASGGTPLDRAHELVQELRGMPTPLPPAPPSRGVDPVEERRREVYRQLRQLEDAAVWALASALSDPDVRMRRNATLALGFLAGGYFVRSRPGLDIRDALPPLIDALQDSDGSVRGWAAQAIGHIGPDAARAVPALITLLANTDEGSRNSACIALRGIGPPAREALPALRQALFDPSADVRRFAQLAIEKIQ